MWLITFILLQSTSILQANHIIVCKTVNSISNINQVTNECSGPTKYYAEPYDEQRSKSSITMEDLNLLRKQIIELNKANDQLFQLRSNLTNLQKQIEAFKACPNNPCVNGNCSYSNNTYLCSCILGYIGTNCQTKCNRPLGMESGLIPDNQITASSQWSDNSTPPSQARLNNKPSAAFGGAWVPAGNTLAPYKYTFSSPGTMWIQVHLVPPQNVTGIIIQGRPSIKNNQFTKSYQVSYSTDGSSFKKFNKTFNGNTDINSTVTNYFPTPIMTSYVRVYPMTWSNAPALRMELLGCN